MAGFVTDSELAQPNDSFEVVQHPTKGEKSPLDDVHVPQDYLDWTGPDDPDNPHNWPVWKKIFHSAIPAIYSFGLYEFLAWMRNARCTDDRRRTTGISTSVAAVPYLMIQFQLARNVALLPITMYTVGIIIGPLICPPFSELYGRRMIYWTNFPMLVIFQIIAAASNRFSVLVIFRFLAGAGGSGVLAVGAGIDSSILKILKLD